MTIEPALISALQWYIALAFGVPFTVMVWILVGHHLHHHVKMLEARKKAKIAMTTARAQAQLALAAEQLAHERICLALQRRDEIRELGVLDED